jgi:hypothetical protein
VRYGFLVERQQAQGKEVAFRGDAASAKPKLYEGLEERNGEIRDPPSRQRQSAAEHHGVVDADTGKAELQADGAVQKLSLSGSELEAGRGRTGLLRRGGRASRSKPGSTLAFANQIVLVRV